jgi:ubiquinone/menaquinone biosynthesis C-methylase UbiE
MSSTRPQSGRICPHQGAFLLDNWLRRRLQPPCAILRGFLEPGDTAIDLGCGPGFFTIPMARLVGPGGCIVAVDLQAPMLDRVRRKARQHGLADRIRCHRCVPEKIGLSLAADFVLAWYMVHETPDPAGFFREVRTLLKDGGRLLVVEPKMHVRRSAFAALKNAAAAAGLLPLAPFGGLVSRGVLLGRA